MAINRKNRRRIFQVFISIMLASFFWYSVKLVKVYNSTIEVPVRYKNPPKGVQLTRELPHELELRVTGPGHLLLVPNLRLQADSLDIDLQPAVETGAIETEDYRSRMARVLPNEVSIRSIRPKHIEVNFEEQMRKRVPVSPQLEITYAPGYRQVGDVVLTPDSVLLVGSISMLQDVEQWSTAPIKVNNLKGARRFRVQLDERPQMYVSAENVTGVVQSQPYTEVKKEVSVEILNSPLDKRVRLLPAKVHVHYQLPTEDHALADTAQPRLVVDATRLSPDRRYVIPTLSGLPDIAIGARLEPSYLRFVLQDKSIQLP